MKNQFKILPVILLPLTIVYRYFILKCILKSHIQPIIIGESMHCIVFIYQTILLPSPDLSNKRPHCHTLSIVQYILKYNSFMGINNYLLMGESARIYGTILPVKILL